MGIHGDRYQSIQLSFRLSLDQPLKSQMTFLHLAFLFQRMDRGFVFVHPSANRCDQEDYVILQSHHQNDQSHEHPLDLYLDFLKVVVGHVLKHNLRGYRDSVMDREYHNFVLLFFSVLIFVGDVILIFWLLKGWRYHFRALSLLVVLERVEFVFLLWLNIPIASQFLGAKL